MYERSFVAFVIPLNPINHLGLRRSIQAFSHSSAMRVVPASELAAARAEIAKLQRVLGKK